MNNNERLNEHTSYYSTAQHVCREGSKDPLATEGSKVRPLTLLFLDNRKIQFFYAYCKNLIF